MCLHAAIFLSIADFWAMITSLAATEWFTIAAMMSFDHTIDYVMVCISYRLTWPCALAVGAASV